DRDLLVGEHVPVAAGGALEAPCLPGGEPVDGELDVGLELARRLGIAGLVVDQLVPAARQLVDTIDTPAQVMRPDPEVELPLDPARMRAAGDLAGVIAAERLDRLLAELQLVIGLAEAGAPPGRRKQGHQALEIARVDLACSLLSLVTLQHLLHDDAKPLLHPRLLTAP